MEFALCFIDGGDMIRDKKREAPPCAAHGIQHALGAIIREVDFHQPAPCRVFAVVYGARVQFIQDAVPSHNFTRRRALIEITPVQRFRRRWR